MKIRAAVVRELNAPLDVADLDLDEPQAGEVLIKMAAAGLCGSDLHAFSGELPRRLPFVPGHEGAGRVVQIGEGVSSIRVGDAVITSFIPSCGRCAQCRRGRRTCCVSGTAPRDGTMLDGTYRIHDGDGGDVGTGTRLAAFSSFSVVQAVSCVVVPQDTNLVSAALLSCGVSTGVGAAINVGRVVAGDTVVVFGAGGVGIAAVQGASIAGATRVIAVDITAAKGDRARPFGATDVINAATDDVVASIRTLTNGFGADVAIIAIDNVRDKHITTAMQALGPGGRAVLVGKPDSSVTGISYSPGLMMYHQQSFSATLAGSLDQHADIARNLDLYRTGRLDLDKFITSTYLLDEINTAIDDLRSGKNIRGVIVFD